MAVDWEQVGLGSITATIVVGSLIMYFCTSIFGLEVLHDLCAIQINEGENASDENDGWKNFMDVCIGIGVAPLVLLVFYLVIKFGCNGNNMTFAVIISVIMGAFGLSTAYIQQDSIPYGLGGALAGILLCALVVGVKQPTEFQPFAIRLCAVGVILFGGVIAAASAAIGKVTDCNTERGCVEDSYGVMPACDSTCDNPPTKTPCGECQSCDLHKNISNKLWILNGVAIGMTTVSIGGLIASAM